MLAAEIEATGHEVAIALGPSEPMVDAQVRADVLAAHDPQGQRTLDLRLSIRVIQSLARQLAPQVTLIDLTPGFQAAHDPDGEKLYHKRNTHWGRAGNELAGRMIASAMQRDWFDGTPLLSVSEREGIRTQLARYRATVPQAVVDATARAAMPAPDASDRPQP